MTDLSTVKQDALSTERDQSLLFKAVLVIVPLAIVAAVVAAVTGWQPSLGVHAVASPMVSTGQEQHPGTVSAAVPVVAQDAPLCSTSGSGQCAQGAAGGPVWAGGRLVCVDPAATLITNVVGALVCDYHLISTASDTAGSAGVRPAPLIAVATPLARHHDVMPLHDGAGEPVCGAGWVLYDTGRAAVGDEGVVCRETLTQT